MSDTDSSDGCMSPPPLALLHSPSYSSDTSSTKSSGTRMKKRSIISCQSPTVPQDVCHWKLKHLDRLYVKYDDDFMPSPLSVLEKTGKFEELTPVQKKYIDTVKFYIQREGFNFGIIGKNASANTYYTSYKPILDDMLETLESEDYSTLSTKVFGMESDVTTEIQKQNITIERWVNLKVREFLFVVERMLGTIAKKRQDGLTVPEITYCELPRAFADLCQLKAWNGKEDPSRIHNIVGVKQVISEPDFRLYSPGMSILKPKFPKVVVSATQTKKDSHTSDDEAVEIHPKRRRLSTGSSDANIQSPAIRKELGSGVLGQHAGELLLDCIRFPLITSEKNLMHAMPGMIIDGTKVYFTLLEITYSLLQKIQWCTQRAQLNFDETDKATIYYSKPFDMLLMDGREILLDSFMQLNNILEKTT